MFHSTGRTAGRDKASAAARPDKRVPGNRDDAQDAAQAAFLNCWQARARLADVRDLRAWVFRAAINAANDLARSSWRRRRRPLNQVLWDRPSAGATPIEHLIDREEV